MSTHKMTIILCMAVITISACSKQEEPEKEPSITRSQLLGQWEMIHDAIDGNENGLLDEGEKMTPLEDWYYVFYDDGTCVYTIHDTLNIDPKREQWWLEGNSLKMSHGISFRKFFVDHVDGTHMQLQYQEKRPDGKRVWEILQKK